MVFEIMKSSRGAGRYRAGWWNPAGVISLADSYPTSKFKPCHDPISRLEKVSIRNRLQVND
jgi:hypothetical protein